MQADILLRNMFQLTTGAIAGVRAVYLLHRDQLSLSDVATRDDALGTIVGEFACAMIVSLLCF